MVYLFLSANAHLAQGTFIFTAIRNVVSKQFRRTILTANHVATWHENNVCLFVTTNDAIFLSQFLLFFHIVQLSFDFGQLLLELLNLLGHWHGFTVVRNHIADLKVPED